MGLVQRTHESGLVVAEESADEAALGHALKQIDRAYVLQKNPDGDTPGLYVVACVVNEDEPPIRILAWADGNGEPLPLSSGLVEKVKAWHVGARNRPETVDEYNARVGAELERDRQRDAEAIFDDHRPYLQRGRVQVSLADGGKTRHARRAAAQGKGGSSR